MSAAAKSTARKELECLLAKLAVDDKPGAVELDATENPAGKLVIARVALRRNPTEFGTVYVNWPTHSQKVGKAVLAALIELARREE
jgi:hypothetical protein